MFAEVAVPVYVHQTFTYALPASFAAQARPGCRALVPFGTQLLTGYIVALHDSLAEAGQDADSYEVKEVEELFDTEPLVTGEMLELTQWIADYYFAPWGEVIKCCLPAGINAEAETLVAVTDAGRAALAAMRAKSANRAQPTTKEQALDFITEHADESGALNSRVLAKHFGKPKAAAVIRELEKSGFIFINREMQDAAVKPKRQQAVRLIASAPIEGSKPFTEQQERVIAHLFDSTEPPALAHLLEKSGVTTSVIRTLEKRGMVEIFTREVRRDPLAHLKTNPQAGGSPSSADGAASHGSGHSSGATGADALHLTPKQQTALDEIKVKLNERQYAAFLLHGVTGSGKTEVYMRAMREVVDQGRTALMLVPEISLTPMFARRLRAYFGDAVAILHSSLSDGERLDEWNRLRQGEARVCIGARSAIFAPLEDLGLIVVDEEHEASYKQEESPRYHGRDTAIMRAAKANAVVILGSATPSMESFHNAHTGKYHYLKLDERIGGRALAEVQVVDMREVFTRHGKQQVFSDELKAAIEENFARGEQTMVLLNRRGFSSVLLCRSCGHSMQCPNCEVTLTYHKSDARLVCHYCNHQERIPRACPTCGGQYIYYVGEGTEQIEALLKEMYPDLRVARLDRDTTRRKGAFERLLGEFATGSVDLLVGTQMIAKGHDFHNVTLVCVISVDAGLSMPDFRAAERSFQLLTQVAGRAGRGDKPGRVLIQSYHPEHYALEYAREQVYEKFYQHEIHFRQAMSYPPFVALINVLVKHGDFGRAMSSSAELVRQLKLADPDRALRILGPAPAPLSRLKGEHRMQVLIKTKNRRRAREALDAAMLALKETGHDLRMLNVEVDPVNLM